MTAGKGHKAIQPAGMSDAPALGYSHGVVAGPGPTLHVAGQVGRGETVVDQLEAALAGVARVCEASGGSMADVVSMTWFTTEAVSSVWGQTAEVRSRLIPDPPPAMTVVQVAGLADPRYRVEVAATAVLPSINMRSEP